MGDGPNVNVWRGIDAKGSGNAIGSMFATMSAILDDYVASVVSLADVGELYGFRYSSKSRNCPSLLAWLGEYRQVCFSRCM